MKHALLRTWPGRAIVIGAAVKIAVIALGLVVPVPTLLGALDTLASVALVGGGLYFVGRGLTFATQRLLWRVRTKLIISYVFIGFIPSILIVAFFLLGGLFLFSNFSSYLVQNEFRSLGDRTLAIASSTALVIQRAGGRDLNTIVARQQAAQAQALPGLSIAVVPAARSCDATGRTDAALTASATAGPWAHVQPPVTLPDWLSDCHGFSSLFSYQAVPGASSNVDLLVRAIGFADIGTPTYAVIVDVPVDDRLKADLRASTGVDIGTFQLRGVDVRPLQGRAATTAPPPPAAGSGLPVTSVTFLEQHDWQTGAQGSVMASMQLSIPDIYRRISAQASGDARFSQGLLLLLVAIGGLFLIIQVFALMAGLGLARSITGSVHELFVGTERVRKGDFTHKIAIPARDQLGGLAVSFNSMTDSIEDLLREQAEKKRLEEELRIAHEIQMSLLPQGPLGMPGLSVTALCVPAREVGGDYYDFFPIDDHRLGVLIADVSGKGTSAALYMAEMKGLMLSLSRIHTSPRDLLIDANRIIAEHLDARSFITMTYAVLDLQKRTMTYARAGHTPLIYLATNGSARQLHVLAPDGLVVGLKIDNGETFNRLLCEETMPIHSGDLLLLFTDGITEAMDASDDCFGEGRLADLLQQHADLTDEELRERVLREISAFVGNAPQHDDMTLLIMRIGDAQLDPAACTAVAAGAGV